MEWDLGTGDRAAWRALNVQLAAPPPPARRTPWWRRHARWLALGLVADVVLGTLVLHLLRDTSSTPERAVTRFAALVHDKDWAAVRGALCAPDRARYSTDEVAQAGQAAMLLLRGVDHFEVERVVTVPDLRVGPVGLATRRVEGKVVALLGPPTEAHVSVVKEPTAWKVCLSAGGYGVAALDVDVPPAGDLLR